MSIPETPKNTVSTITQATLLARLDEEELSIRKSKLIIFITHIKRLRNAADHFHRDLCDAKKYWNFNTSLDDLITLSKTMAELGKEEMEKEELISKTLSNFKTVNGAINAASESFKRMRGVTLSLAYKIEESEAILRNFRSAITRELEPKLKDNSITRPQVNLADSVCAEFLDFAKAIEKYHKGTLKDFGVAVTRATDVLNRRRAISSGESR